MAYKGNLLENSQKTSELDKEDKVKAKLAHEGTQGKQITPEAFPFTKEQPDHIKELFRSPNFQVYSSCSFTEKGNFMTTLLRANSSQANNGIIHTRATNHMTSCSHLFPLTLLMQGTTKSKLSIGHCQN